VLGAVIGAAGALALVLWLAPPLALLHHHDLPFERLYGNAAVTLAARLGGAGNRAGPSVTGAGPVVRGREAYTGSCASCHGDKGDGRGVWGQASYPPATDLTAQTVRVKTDAQLFWIVKNGLGFAGMPAFGGQYSDENVWSLVTYMRVLQQRQGSPPAIPTPTTEQLSAADPGGDSVQRGAAVYFAQGCHFCHGPIGDAPANLGLFGDEDITKPVREGDRDGMPFYSSDRITDAELADLAAYFRTFADRQGLQPGR